MILGVAAPLAAATPSPFSDPVYEDARKQIESAAWERYRGYILTGTIVVGLQSTLIAALVIQRARRRRIEVALRASEAELRQSSERNQDLAGRLLAAQEAERTRIARDLHDDVGQQLAGVGIMLSGLKRLLRGPEPPRDAAETVTVLQARTNVLAETLRHLSHELHPGVLTKLGLVAALQQHTGEVEQHYGITVTLDAPATFDVDPDVALCLYPARRRRSRTARTRARTGRAGGAEANATLPSSCVSRTTASDSSPASGARAGSGCAVSPSVCGSFTAASTWTRRRAAARHCWSGRQSPRLTHRMR